MIFSDTGYLISFWINVLKLKMMTDFKAAKKIVHSLRVVNDIAERGVALMEEYNKLMTTDEEQKQYLLLLVK